MGAPDLGEVRGCPEVIRGCAADLRSVIGSLGSARSAAADIESALGSPSWTGEAHAALVEQQADFPSPDDIDNAGRILERGASVLDRLAGQVEDCQLRLEHCRQRLSVMLVNGEVPPEMEGEVDRIKADAEEVRDDHRRALDDAAGAFDEMDDQTVYAQPPPSLMEQAGDALGSIARFTGDFVVGMVEGVVEIVKGLGQLAFYLGTPAGWYMMWQKREQIGAIIRYARDNPGEFFTTLGQAMIDWDTLKENPARWLGKLVPNILLAVATGGAGTAAGRAGALASRLTRFPRAVTALNRVSTGLNAADEVASLGRVVPILRRGPAGLHIELHARTHWAPNQLAGATRKVGHLDSEGRAGRLQVTAVNRRKLPSQKAMWEKENGPTPTGMQIDHLTDLQLGGPHVLENLGPLDSTVNLSLGPQINMLLSGRTGGHGVPYPVGTPVSRVTMTVSDAPAAAKWVEGSAARFTWTGTAAGIGVQVQNPGELSSSLGSSP